MANAQKLDLYKKRAAEYANDSTGRLASAVRQALAEAQESLAAASTPMEMREFVETYVGPMVLKPDGNIQRKETPPAEAEAVRDRSPTGQETEPLHAGRVKRLIAGARSLPFHAMRDAFWERWGAAA